MSISEISENMSAWCLRGYAAPNHEILPVILIQIRNENFGLGILDSTQKILGDLEENRSSNINKLMNPLEEVCFETGASLVITLHCSKGNKANRQTGERPRGSSVFMGHVDAAIEFVAQQDADESNNILAVEAVWQEFPPVKPFCVQPA